MEVPMQSAREPGVGHARAASALRVPARNRTLVWFSADAERRRRAAAAADGVVASHAKVWYRPGLFGCVALAALGLAVAGPALNVAGMRPCRTTPPVLTPGTDLDVRMVVSHAAACAIWAKAGSISVDDTTITTTPQHGTLVPRGRTGVTYRPSHGFIGDDFFAFAWRKKPGGRGETSSVQVRVTVK
jgi:hypothetical protein